MSYAVAAGPATISGNTVSFSGTGSVTITASQGGDGNWNAAPSASRTFTVNSCPVNFSLNRTSFTYNGNVQGPSVTAAPSAAAYNTSGTWSATAAGTYTATATATGYYSGSAGLPWVINKADQTIAFPTPGSAMYGTPFSLTATASSGLAVTYAVASGPATVSGSTVTPTGTGSVTITASQAGDSNYNAAASVARSFTVNACPTSFALSQSSFTYNGSTQGPSVIANPAGASFTTSGLLSAVTVGSYSVVVTATGNYTGSATLPWAIAPSGQTITFPAPVAQTYGTPLSLTATSSSGLPVSYKVGAGPVTITGSTATFTGTGDVTITAYQDGNTNFGRAADVSRSFTVGPLGTTFSLSQTSFTYTGSAQGPTVVPNVVGATFATTGALSATNAGSYSVTATATGNYTGTSSSLSWTIAKAGQAAVGLTPASQTIVGGQTVSFTASGGSGTGAFTWGGASAGAGAAQTITFNTAGTFTVTVFRAADGNYNQSNTATATIVVQVPPAAPSNLQASAGSTLVTLTWNTSGAGVDHYEIRRNGTLIASTGAAALTCTDTAVEPNSNYTYAVRAVGTNGLGSSDCVASVRTSAPLEVFTPTP